MAALTKFFKQSRNAFITLLLLTLLTLLSTQTTTPLPFIGYTMLLTPPPSYCKLDDISRQHYSLIATITPLSPAPSYHILDHLLGNLTDTNTTHSTPPLPPLLANINPTL